MSFLAKITRQVLPRAIQACSSQNNKILSTSRIVAVRYISRSSEPLEEDRLLLQNAEWERKLTKEQYYVTREHGTEMPFSGEHVHTYENGTYKCVCCGLDLFSSTTKYDSGTGWPSFYASVEDEVKGESNVMVRHDDSLGMSRNEVICRKCDAHLGHVFKDGPKPTGLRYCINSVALKFKGKQE